MYLRVLLLAALVSTVQGAACTAPVLLDSVAHPRVSRSVQHLVRNRDARVGVQALSASVQRRAARQDIQVRVDVVHAWHADGVIHHVVCMERVHGDEMLGRDPLLFALV